MRGGAATSVAHPNFLPLFGAEKPQLALVRTRKEKWGDAKLRGGSGSWRSGTVRPREIWMKHVSSGFILALGRIRFPPAIPRNLRPTLTSFPIPFFAMARELKCCSSTACALRSRISLGEEEDKMGASTSTRVFTAMTNIPRTVR